MNPFNAIFPSCLSLLYIHQYSWHSYDPTPQFPHHCCTGKIIQDHQIPQARWTPIKSYTYLPMIGGCVQKSGKNPHKDDFDRTRTLNQWILCTLFSDSPYSNLVRHLFVIMVVKILNVQKPVHLSFGTWLPMILKYNVDSRKKTKKVDGRNPAQASGF